MMTNIVLPGMLIRKRGAVINISSGSAYVPVPALSVYSATKAYVDVFTRALQTEYQSSGVIFQAVLPFLVATNMSKIKPNGHFIPSAGAYVRSCLATLGNESRTAGYIMHEIQKLIATSLPEGFYNRQLFQQIEAASKQYQAYRNKRDK